MDPGPQSLAKRLSRPSGRRQKSGDDAALVDKEDKLASEYKV